jgi:hypothetical protein
LGAAPTAITPTWSYTVGPTVDPGAACSFGDEHALSTSIACTDDGTYTVTLSAGGGSDTATVTVTNAVPVVVAPTAAHLAPSAPVKTGTEVVLGVQVSDAGANDRLSCRADWGAGVTSRGTVSGSTCTVTTTGTPVGLTRPTVTVDDGDGGTATATLPYLVTYAPNTPMVAGSGWFASGEGNLRVNKALTGDADFAFDARVGSAGGRTVFRFAPGNLTFESTSQTAATVTSKSVATFSGTGTVNGSGSYTFQVSALDGELAGRGDPDRISIKVWDATGTKVVYDVKSVKRIDLSGGGVVVASAA